MRTLIPDKLPPVRRKRTDNNDDKVTLTPILRKNEREGAVIRR